MQRSARRHTVRATCSAAAAGEPPGSTNDRSGVSSAFSVSISSSSRLTCCVRHAQALARGLCRGLAVALGDGQVGAEIEEVVLDAPEHGFDVGILGRQWRRATPRTALVSSTVP